MAFSTYNSFQRNLTTITNIINKYIFGVDASLVLYYPFSSANTKSITPNYASGQAVYDGSMCGTSKITTVLNTYVTNIADLSLNNTIGKNATDYIVASNTFTLVPSTGLSISCWFSCSGQLNTNQTLFSLPLENANGINVTISDTNTIYSSYGIGIINTLSQTTKQNLLYSGTVLSAGAYGVKLLNTLYYGPVMTIRRSSDSISANFYADISGNLGTNYLATGTTLTSWLSGATAYVSTWWDQTGNSRNATQNDTTRQPIYDLINKCIVFTAISNTNTNYFNLPDGTHPFNNSNYTYISKFSTTNYYGGLFGAGLVTDTTVSGTNGNIHGFGRWG